MKHCLLLCRQWNSYSILFLNFKNVNLSLLNKNVDFEPNVKVLRLIFSPLPWLVLAGYLYNT